MVADFQMEGMSAVAMERMPKGPACCRWRIVRLSGPAALEDPDCRSASVTWVVVKGGKIGQGAGAFRCIGRGLGELCCGSGWECG